MSPSKHTHPAAAQPANESAPPAPPPTPLPAQPTATNAQQVPALWLALLATPVAANANSPVLILPDIADSLGVRTATATWLVTAFAWAMAVGTPLMAGLLRRRGLRTTLTLSTALIITGTALLVAAPWPLAVAGRAAQAAGGAGLITAAMSMAGSVRRMGVITAGFGTLGAVGPLLGSAIANISSWRISLAVGAVALLAVPAVIRRTGPSAPREGTPFDSRGAALLALTATALVLIPRYPLPAVGASAGAAMLLALHVRSHPAGFVPAALLRTRTFVLSAALACAFATSYFTLLFTVPQLLRDRSDWTATTIGTAQMAALLTGSALAMAMAAVAAQMSHARALTILLTAGSLGPLTAALTPWPPLLLPVATLAVFTATAGQATLAIHATTPIPPAERPAALGLFTLCYQLGGAFGPALATTLILGA